MASTHCTTDGRDMVGRSLAFYNSVGPSPISRESCCSFSVTPPSLCIGEVHRVHSFSPLSAMSSLRAGTGGGGKLFSSSSSSSSSTISSCRMAWGMTWFEHWAVLYRDLSHQLSLGHLGEAGHQAGLGLGQGSPHLLSCHVQQCHHLPCLGGTKGIHIPCQLIPSCPKDLLTRYEAKEQL